MRLRHVSDNTRATVCGLLAVPVSLAAAPLVLSAGDDGARADPLIAFYLPFWPTFAASYLVWTHRAYTRRGAAGVAEAAEAEHRTRARWWNRVLGSSDGSSLTLAGAVVAVLITLSIAQVATYRSDPVFVVLGLVTVAASWGLMVYSFALDYLRLDQQLRHEGRSHIGFHLGADDGPPVFGDYLTFTVLASTMAATISADVPSREVWRLVRRNVLVAFAFNSVVVAMVVSLLFGGLAG